MWWWGSASVRVQTGQLWTSKCQTTLTPHGSSTSPHLPHFLTTTNNKHHKTPHLETQFGSAITYLYEVAPVGRKGLIASLGQLAVSPGMALGILLCQAVLYGCTQGT